MIVVDASALIAILLDEAEAATFVSILARSEDSCIAAPTLFETMIVAISKKEAVGVDDVHRLLAEFGIAVVPWTPGMAEFATEAFHRFGRSRHKAALNFGDCISYALAKSLDAPLLYKGNDFALTDIRVVV